MMAGQIVSAASALAQTAAALSPWVPSTGASKAGDVDPAWLTEHVGRAVGARALSAGLLDGTTGTTDRRRLRVEWDGAGREAALPTHLFIKSTPLSVKNRLMVAPLEMSVNEVRFYRHAATELEDITPKVWFTSAGAGARFLIVLDDLVAHGAKPYALADYCPIDHARALVDVFARLHAHFWQSPRFGQDLPWVRTWSTRPGYRVLKTFYKRGRRAALRLDLPEATSAVRAVAHALDSNIDAYYRLFETGPLTLLHGDSHLGNTYALPDGRAGLLDWQVVWRGPGLREVTYWMVTGLEPEVRQAHDRELLQRYLDGLRANGVAEVPSMEQAYQQLRLFSAEAWDATAMTIAWPGLQAPENMQAAWRRACVAVEDLDSASAVARLR